MLFDNLTALDNLTTCLLPKAGRRLVRRRVVDNILQEAERWFSREELLRPLREWSCLLYTSAVFLVVIIVICSFVLSKTVYGRRVYACGGNLLAAKVSGINTTMIRISTFAIAGLLAGLSGFLMTSRVTIGQPLSLIHISQ